LERERDVMTGLGYSRKKRKNHTPGDVGSPTIVVGTGHAAGVEE